MLAGLLIACVTVYKEWISPFLPKRCRFSPTCSSYMVLALQKYGPIKGLGKGCLRICKCHPFHQGGVDYP